MSTGKKLTSIVRFMLAMALLAGLLQGSGRPAYAATQIDIHGLAGSGQFAEFTLLPNGNIVVVDYKYDLGSVTDAGAVYLYNGATGAQISMLTGSSANDQVGRGGVTVLTNGNYVVESPVWDNGTIADAGAVTWGSQVSGVSGTVSAANSLVGSTAGDQIGCVSGDPGICWVGDIDPLSNGNYVVVSPQWHNGAAANAGAATWGDGTVGVKGVVSAANSLVGSTAGDRVGCYYGGDDYCSQADVTQLSNGNYLVRSYRWGNGAAANAGAVTWANGASGVKGVVSAANSLVGGTENDYIGFRVATLAGNSNYLVYGTEWDNGPEASAGAVTWGSGSTGVKGPVSAANSLVGSTANDGVGFDVYPLSNGNYVVTSYCWDNGSAACAGSATWGNGSTGIAGPVTPANSLVGTQTGDAVGLDDVTPLNNGNYVVSSSDWDNGAVKGVGAVTWGNGTTGITGPVSTTNSLVGSTANDGVGFPAVTALTNGNYVVTSYFWDDGGKANVGAVTWGNGSSGTKGVVSADNSLVGGTADDWAGRYQFMGSKGVTPLSNGNYVVRSSYWDNGAAADAGAVTWGNGSGGTKGVISAANSLVGGTAGDFIGYDNVTPLSSGDYVVTSLYWHNGGAANAGAVTWGNGSGGTKGVVSAANSLVGSTADDRVGCAEFSNKCYVPDVFQLSNGNYVVVSPDWDNGGITDAGAVTWGNGTTGVKGLVSAANSLVGGTVNDKVGNRFVVPLSNGNYVVRSPHWDNGAIANAGAVTWGNGTSGIKGQISMANSLVGSTVDENTGYPYVLALSDGNYVVTSSDWDLGAIQNAGAVTWADGAVGITGVISSTNSLVGSTADDALAYRVLELSSGRYLVYSRNWDNGSIADAGAVTWSPESGGVSGEITAENSVLGTSENNYMVYAYDPVNNQLVVGRYTDNIVTLVKLAPAEADLEVSKSATPDPVTIGDDLTYTITVTNHGPGDATDVVITDTLPVSVTYISSSAGCTHAAGVVTCTSDGIANGASKSVDIIVRITTNGSLTNTASASADQTDPEAVNNSDTITTQAIHRKIYMPLMIKH